MINNWQLLKMVNTETSCDPTIPLLHIYPRKLKAYVHTKTRTGITTAALFITAKKWKRFKWPSTDEWIN